MDAPGSISSIPLLPQPRNYEAGDGVLVLPASLPVAVVGDKDGAARALARLRAVLTDAGLHAEIVTFPGDAAILLSLDDGAGHATQGYTLDVKDRQAHVTASDPAGLFYGVATLAQLLDAPGEGVPICSIEDRPDILQRGVMLDISRDKVPTMDTLFMLVDMFAAWKINHLQLYMEHTFAYGNHREVWAAADPMTAEEIRTLDAYCRDRFIELTPNQNSFGHMERWLRHGAYRPLAECPDGYRLPDGEWRDGPWSMDPTNPASLELLRELYDELLPNFSSRQFHVGCDEAWDVGQGRSKAACESRGREQVFLDFLSSICDLVRPHDRILHYWGDMIWQHKAEPEIALDRLDREAVMVDWGYIRDYPFEEHGEALAREGIPFWFAPGTGVWSTLVGCNEAAFGSNRSAACAGLRHGALGILNTDWGDGGHWQQLPVSFIGFAAGAAMGWCEETNTDETIRESLDLHVFRDEAGIMGCVALDLADTWERVGEKTTQPNLLDRILRGGLGRGLPEKVTETTLLATRAHFETCLARLPDVRLQRRDAGLIVDEFANGIRTALHACRVGLAIAGGAGDAARSELAEDLAGIIEERRRLWPARNRPCGLRDSLRPLEERLGELRA